MYSAKPVASLMIRRVAGTHTANCLISVVSLSNVIPPPGLVSYPDTPITASFWYALAVSPGSVWVQDGDSLARVELP
jgi:hypothetical protein